MTKFNNTKKESYLKNFTLSSIDLDNDDITKRCKFNFSYMDFNQPAGQKFEDWGSNQLVKLLNKLKDYSRESLKYWNQQKIGANHVLEFYEKFPINSEFKHPKHVPHQAVWARFRLEGSVRLIGFVLPENYHKTLHKGTNEIFDCNTFYAVFLDANHKFYLSQN